MGEEGTEGLASDCIGTIGGGEGEYCTSPKAAWDILERQGTESQIHAASRLVQNVDGTEREYGFLVYLPYIGPSEVIGHHHLHS